MESTFVIIGGGIAGTSCAEMLSQIAPEESIILISASPIIKAATNIRHITDNLSSFDVAENNVSQFKSAYKNVTVLVDEVTSFDAEKHVITCKSDKKIIYEQLCLCHGARPKSIRDANPHVMTIRDTESVGAFQERLKGAERIIIVGNGGIATELVYELETLDVVWAIKDDSISATFFDPGAGQFFMEFLNTKQSSNCCKSSPRKSMRYELSEVGGKKSVRGAALGPDWHSNMNFSETLSAKDKHVLVEYECEVKNIYSSTEFSSSKMKEDLAFDDGASLSKLWNIYVELTNGKVYGCDFLVSATGVISNGDLIPSRPVALDLFDDNSVIVNENMKTNLDDVYAAGDVCHANWGLKNPKHWFQMKLWTQARQMGMYAGQNMVDSRRHEKERTLDFCFEMFSHVTSFFGFKIILLGLFNGQGFHNNEYEAILRVTKGKEFVKVILKEGKMQGALLIGETDLEETFENLILNQMDLSQYGEDLLNPDVDIEDYFD